MWLQAVEFFINNYELDSRFLTASLVAAVVLFPAAIIWNWRHGEVGAQPFARSEVATYVVSLVLAGIAASWYWSSTPGEVPRQVVAAKPVRSIAVMPFVNVSDDANVQYLCDGIAENLIYWMSSIPDVRVISKNAAFRLRDLVDDPAAIAAELGVDSVISGELQVVGEQVVISARMLDARDESQVWGARLVESSRDVLQLERSIVDVIKNGLSLEITGDQSTASGGTDNPEAYDRFMRGHFLIQSTNRESIIEGIDELRESIRLDPGFARPYADIADALAQMLTYGALEGAEFLGEARNAAYTAIGLAPDLSEAHAALATIHQFFDFDWVATDAAYEKAVQLNPQSPAPFHRYTDYLVLTFRFDLAKEMALRGLEVDPLDSSSMHGIGLAHLIAGDFDEAAKAFGEWNQFHPGSRWSYIKHALGLALSGDCERALQQANTVDAMYGGDAPTLNEAWLAWGYKVCGNDELYQRSYERIMAKHEQQPNPYDPGLAYLRALEGDVDGLVGQLERVVADRDPFTLFSKLFSIDYLGFGVSGQMLENDRYRALIESLKFP